MQEVKTVDGVQNSLQRYPNPSYVKSPRRRRHVKWSDKIWKVAGVNDDQGTRQETLENSGEDPNPAEYWKRLLLIFLLLLMMMILPFTSITINCSTDSVNQNEFLKMKILMMKN